MPVWLQDTQRPQLRGGEISSRVSDRRRGSEGPVVFKWAQRDCEMEEGRCAAGIAKQGVESGTRPTRPAALGYLIQQL